MLQGSLKKVTATVKNIHKSCRFLKGAAFWVPVLGVTVFGVSDLEIPVSILDYPFFLSIDV